MRLKMAERDKLKRLLMRGLKHDQRREAGLPRLFPARGAQAPAVALMQPAKAIFGAGGGQVVADGAGELQELVRDDRSEEHTSELQSLMRISYAVFCLIKQNKLQSNLITTSS